MLNYKGNLWVQKNYVLGNKTQYPLFLGTVAGTLLLYLYCDFVLLQKYCEIPNLSKVIVTFQILSIYSMFRVNMTEPGVQMQTISDDKYFDGKLCEKCKAIKIDRCYHCKFCDHCVNDFEAHCFLMATCIGRRNIKYLLGLVTFTGIALYLLLLILIYKLFVSDCKKELTFIILNIVSLVLTLVHLNPFIYTTWRNASQNWTKKEMNRTKFNGSFSYIYNNYKQFFTRFYDSQLYASFMQN
ncbi:unnamed protein product [Paramecium pentaurelia]|uniref:Palmitoyltransferase n=1 Tax=Paramecium pentaurelia TaxID=43138 RepID=A0A8S1S9G9_9CILI|nr:unnamed protein product [Paramecium pentaurelia]